MGKLLDARGVPIESAEERATGVPDWCREPVESWPVGFAVHDAEMHQPDRFYLGDRENRVWVLLEGDWRKGMTVEELVGVAAGALEGIAKRRATRAEAEMIARAWIKIANDWREVEREQARTLGEAIRRTLH